MFILTDLISYKSDDSLSLEAAGVQDGDMLMGLPNGFGNQLQNRPRTTSQSSSGPPDFNRRATELLERFAAQSEDNQRAALANFSGWPTMANAIRTKNISQIAELLKSDYDQKVAEQTRLRQAEANPMDPENQKYLEDRIQQKNIDESYTSAMENSPEMFGTVIMLYIDCKVNGVAVKAFVDSGAQMTIMSQACAERCHTMRLLDTRFSGIAKGVGTQKILGRVHTGQIQIENAFIPQSFSVMENQPMDLLIGLDMLKRHQCVLDLAKNELLIGTTGTRVKFLSEGELDASARISGPAAEAAQNEEMEIEEALAASRNDKPSTSAPVPSATPLDPKVKQIMEITKCSIPQAKSALEKSGGDVNAATLNLLTSGLFK